MNRKTSNRTTKIDIDAEDTLFHYCSLETFRKIIAKKSIWLSDLTKTNDSQELIWIKGIVERNVLPEIEKQLEQIKQEREKGQIEERKKKENQERERQWTYAKNFLSRPSFEVPCWGFCLSAEEDDLGQWRGYGDDGAGISIGFNCEKLRQLIPSRDVVTLGKPRLTLSAVSYGTEDDILDELDDRAKDITGDKEKYTTIGKLVYGPENKIEVFSDIADVIAKEIITVTTFPFYKMQAFKKEAECRIVFSIPKEKIPPKGLCNEAFQNLDNFEWPCKFQFKKYEYSVRNNDLVPHIEINLEKSLSDIIKSITIGPKSKVTKEDVWSFLKANGIDLDIKNIEKSGASYR